MIRIMTNKVSIGMTLRFLRLLTGLAIIGIVVGCSGMGNRIQLTAEEGTELRVYEIFGMDCPGCHGGLVNLIDKVPGVIASQANWEKLQLIVKVRITANVTDEAIFEAVRNANFTPGERLK